jgi:hypothetical protein
MLHEYEINYNSLELLIDIAFFYKLLNDINSFLWENISHPSLNKFFSLDTIPMPR